MVCYCPEREPTRFTRPCLRHCRRAAGVARGTPRRPAWSNSGNSRRCATRQASRHMGNDASIALMVAAMAPRAPPPRRCTRPARCPRG
eukprot:scaffold75982_cov65-Phaeocystis_antarctica.AAC.12